MRRSAVRDHWTLFVDTVICWIAIIALTVSVGVYLLRNAARDRRD